MRSEEEQYLDKWREKEEKQSVFGARFGKGLFRDASVCHQSLGSAGLAPPPKGRPLACPAGD